MGKSIVTKGKDVQEALRMALQILEVNKSEVDIEIVERETKGILGIGAKPAVVRVTLRDESKSNDRELPPSIDQLEEMMGSLDISDLPFPGKTGGIPKLNDSLDPQDTRGTAWVSNGQVFSQNAPDKYPIICPGKHMKLLLNGLEFHEQVVVNDGDHVQVVVEDACIEPVWDIRLSDHRMEAAMVITIAGERIFRELKDKAPSSYLQLEVSERKEPYAIDQADIFEKLKQLNIIHGIDFAEITKACASQKSGTFIIASGDASSSGTDGYFKPQMEIDIKKGIKERADGTVDYRETLEFPSIERGQVLGVVQPPVQGKPGKAVTGEPVMPQDVHPLQIETGKGTVLIDGNKVVATEAGHPELKLTGRAAKISVVPKLVINKDITLETGNVHYIGDVEIHGSIQDNMFVDAQGNAFVRNNVNNAKLSAGQSIIIRQNIISSEVTAGAHNILVMELSQLLGEILETIRKMVVAIQQLGKVSAFKVGSFTRTGLGPLIKILCDGKFKSFVPLTQSFIHKISAKEDALGAEWGELGVALNHGFIRVQSSNLRTEEDILCIIRKGEELYQRSQSLKEDAHSFIQAGFAHHSKLYSDGDIHIVGQGCYNSKLHAGGFVRINGFVRGGEIYGKDGVKVDEAGTRGGSMTKIRVPGDRAIQIQRALADTLIQVGQVPHRFLQETSNIRARLDEHGDLQLH